MTTLSPNEIHQLRERIEAHRRTLAHYLKQMAIVSEAHAKPEISAGICTARQEVARLKAALRANHEHVDDRIDDGQVTPEPSLFPSTISTTPLAKPAILSPLRKYLSAESIAVTIFCALFGAVLGANNGTLPSIGFAAIGAAIACIVIVIDYNKNQYNRHRAAYFLICLYIPSVFTDYIQTKLKQRWYVTPADLDHIGTTHHIPQEFMYYALAYYAQKFPEQVNYTYVYDLNRHPVAYQRVDGGRIEPIKVLVDITSVPQNGYILNPYPLL